MESQKKYTPKFRPHSGLKLMDPVREVLHCHRYAYRTEQTYGQWILRDIRRFGGKTHPNRLGTEQVARVLAHLALEGQGSASTPWQALNALGFLYRDVLHTPLERTSAPARSQRRPRPPAVLTQAEVRRLLAAMTGRHAPMARLLYGGPLRLLERIRLRSSRPILRRSAPQEPEIHLPACGDDVILDRLSGIFVRYLWSAISGHHRGDRL